jgi:catechol 2,3-dioxygenase-like lactoylglutathione lyase family enzyme
MSHVRRFDHVGLTVADLDVVTAFFVALGLEVEGRTFVEGEFLDTVSGIPNSRTEIVMLKPPNGGTRLELSSFVRSDSVPGSPAAMANELGLRNVAFEVNDLQAAIDWAATEGYGLVGGIGEYEGVWRMAYVRGAGRDHRLPGRAHRLSLATPAPLCRQSCARVWGESATSPRSSCADHRVFSGCAHRSLSSCTHVTRLERRHR